MSTAALERPAAAPAATPEPIWAWLAPLLDDAVDAVLAAAPPLPTGGDREALVRQALPTGTLAMMAGRTALLELHIARLRNQLTGSTPEARRSSFARRVADPDVAAAMWSRWPALHDAIERTLAHWTDATVELLTRWRTDAARITTDLLHGSPAGALVRLQTGLGDPHGNHRTVAVLTFASGDRVVYKPRSLALEQRVRSWIERIHRAAGDDAPMPGRVLCRSTWGWQAYVAPAPCRTAHDVALYHRRLGRLAAVLWLVDATDLHHENLVAAGAWPVPIDLECVLQPRAYDHQGPDGQPVGPAVDMHSVLHTGLFPRGFERDAEGRSADISGAGATASLAVGAWMPTDAGSDTERLEWRTVDVPLTQAHRPRFQGAPVDLVEHEHDVRRGFTEGFRALAAHSEALAGWAETLAPLPTRVLNGNTDFYGRVLEASFHPDFLGRRDGRAPVVDRVLDGSGGRRWFEALAPLEREAVHRGEVPLLLGTVGGVHLREAGGGVCPEPFALSGLAILKARIAALTDGTLRSEQVALAQSFALARIQRGHANRFRPMLVEGAVDAARVRRALAKVCAVLAASAVRGGPYAFWTTLRQERRDGWGVGLLGISVQRGSTGIGLVLLEAARLLDDPDLRDVARAALHTAVLMACREQAPTQRLRLPTSPRLGWAGVVDALARARTLDADPWQTRHLPFLLDHLETRDGAALTASLADLHASRPPTRVPGPVGGRDHHGIEGGLAGLLLDAIERSDPPPLASPAVRVFAAPLLDAIERDGLYGPNPIGHPTPELERGLAGVALALVRLLDPSVPPHHRARREP